MMDKGAWDNVTISLLVDVSNLLGAQGNSNSFSVSCISPPQRELPGNEVEVIGDRAVIKFSATCCIKLLTRNSVVNF